MTFVNTKKTPVKYDPSVHQFFAKARQDPKCYDGKVAVARLRNDKDHAVWVTINAHLLENDKFDPIEQIEVPLVSDIPKDWILVKRGDRWVSLLTTSESERAKRRVLRRVSRQLKRKSHRREIKIVRGSDDSIRPD